MTRPHLSCQPLGVPAAEPLTLADLKAWLRLDGSDEDDLLVALLTAARCAVVEAAGRRLVTQDWRMVLDAWPPDGILTLPLAPVQAVTAVRVRDAAGGATVLPASAWLLDASSDPPRLLLMGSPQAPGRRLGGIEVDLTAGYGPPAAVPEPLRMAVRLTAACLYEHRGDGPDKAVAAVPPAAATLIAPFRRVRL
ncbi:MAG: head-tail connector protein [Alsobacter sp.]